MKESTQLWIADMCYSGDADVHCVLEVRPEMLPGDERVVCANREDQFFADAKRVGARRSVRCIGELTLSRAGEWSFQPFDGGWWNAPARARAVRLPTGQWANPLRSDDDRRAVLGAHGVTLQGGQA